jgi:hypothetical protein
MDEEEPDDTAVIDQRTDAEIIEAFEDAGLTRDTVVEHHPDFVPDPAGALDPETGERFQGERLAAVVRRNEEVRREIDDLTDGQLVAELRSLQDAGKID